ncbi:hypothetical protein AB6C91_00770 [Vibrio cyclitrophicus]
MTESALILPTCDVFEVGFFHFYLCAIYTARPRRYWGFAVKPEFQKLKKNDENCKTNDL